MNAANGIFLLAEETLGYQTSDDPSNADKHLLVAGSQNVLINYQKKVQSRGGYTRLGAAAQGAPYNVKNAWTWNTSTGTQIPQRNSNTSLEAYLGIIDGVALNSWETISSIFSATNKLRHATFFDANEEVDTQVMVCGDDNMYEWNGAIAIASSATNSGGNAIQLRGNNALLTSFVVSYSGTASNVDFGQNYVFGTSLAAFFEIINNPANNDTLVLNINGTNVTITFVNSIGSAAGNVLIGGGPATTQANLLNLLQHPSTTSANQVALSSPNQILVGYLTATTTGTITKQGVTSFSENRFFTTRNTVLKNLRTGTTYAYSQGNGGQTLLNVAGDTTTIQAGDILIQEVITQQNTPSNTLYTNDYIYGFQNQIAISSSNSNQAYLSKNTSYHDFTFSSPRLPGEGATFVLDAPGRAISVLGSSLLYFAGNSFIHQAIFQQTNVPLSNGSSIVEENAQLKRLMTGIDQGALNHESVIPIGNQLAYLSNEVTLRVINNPANVVGLQPTSYSNPIKPDFDAESFDQNSFLFWFKNVVFVSVPATGHQYMLNFIEDADGRLFRFWNPPQTFPIGPLSTINTGSGDALYGHSNAVDESYLLFDGLSDGQYTGMPVSAKLPISCIAAYAYDDTIFVRRKQIKLRSELKTFDEFYIEGEIVPNVTDLDWLLNYDYQGATLQIERSIDGSNSDILEGVNGLNSLAQSSLGQNPLGGLLNTPTNAQKFRLVFECAKEDYFQIQPIYSTNGVDLYWSIIAQGPNAALSPRKATNIRM